MVFRYDWYILHVVTKTTSVWHIEPRPLSWTTASAVISFLIGHLTKFTHLLDLINETHFTLPPSLSLMKDQTTDGRPSRTLALSTLSFYRLLTRYLSNARDQDEDMHFGDNFQPPWTTRTANSLGSNCWVLLPKWRKVRTQEEKEWRLCEYDEGNQLGKRRPPRVDVGIGQTFLLLPRKHALRESFKRPGGRLICRLTSISRFWTS